MDKVAEIPTQVQVKEQGVPKDGTLMPREISSALGRGLRQSFAQSLQRINSEREKLEGNKWTNSIKIGQDKVEFNLRGLEHAGEVRLVPGGQGNGDPGDHFEYSEEAVDEKPKAGDVTTDTMTVPIIKALSHIFRNALAPVQGFSELIEAKADNEAGVKDSGRLIKEAAFQILEKLDSLNDAENIKLLTDSNGETSVLPLRSTKTSE